MGYLEFNSSNLRVMFWTTSLFDVWITKGLCSPTVFLWALWWLYSRNSNMQLNSRGNILDFLDVASKGGNSFRNVQKLVIFTTARMETFGCWWLHELDVRPMATYCLLRPLFKLCLNRARKLKWIWNDGFIASIVRSRLKNTLFWVAMLECSASLSSYKQWDFFST